MLSFYSTLGINRDKNNFDFNNILNENKNRKYRISFMDPMNSNIAFVLYKCSSKINNKIVDKYLIRAFLNENIIKLEACQSEDCELHELINYYSRFINKCESSEKVCSLSAPSSSSAISKMILQAPIFFLFFSISIHKMLF